MTTAIGYPPSSRCWCRCQCCWMREQQRLHTFLCCHSLCCPPPGGSARQQGPLDTPPSKSTGAGASAGRTIEYFELSPPQPPLPSAALRRLGDPSYLLASAVKCASVQPPAIGALNAPGLLGHHLSARRSLAAALLELGVTPQLAGEQPPRNLLLLLRLSSIPPATTRQPGVTPQLAQTTHLADLNATLCSRGSNSRQPGVTLQLAEGERTPSPSPPPPLSLPPQRGNWPKRHTLPTLTQHSLAAL
ncbi:hypothetical protein K505DRAFT_369494 [Melanomma pulvis-pyrius CBS 109.77]|uniref:Uncharacterized protein n=1 Tax=Melanomma pulvis-pyrius CBS 109.77 TaxID=1314802 RepID=A0A6A6WMY8_9PLEO|nr:hypothetical protein K505DRAFT_369494 [Melanomma pulvis-pyrius CBS 109.77]